MTKRVDWHAIVQDLFDQALDAMSGYQMVKQGREKRSYYQIDYLCEVDPERAYDGPIGGIRPFAHLKQLNVFEFKFFGDTLNESLFRFYSGRALMRTHAHPPDRATLTILTAHKPEKLLAIDTYDFTRVDAWRWCSSWINGLEISIIPLIALRDIAGGEAMVYLQALIDDPARQQIVWPELLRRELAAKELLKNVIMAIDEEAFMSIAEELIAEGILTGEKELLLRLLERAAPAARAAYEAQITAADDLDQLRKLEARILQGTRVELK